LRFSEAQRCGSFVVGLLADVVVQETGRWACFRRECDRQQRCSTVCSLHSRWWVLDRYHVFYIIRHLFHHVSNVVLYTAFFVNIVCSWCRDFSRFTLQITVIVQWSCIIHLPGYFSRHLSQSFWSWTQFMTFMRRSHQSFVVTNTPLVLMSGSACASCGNRGWPGMNSANMVEEVHSANL